MRIGLALPQYDYSIAGESPLRWESVVEFAVAAERAGYDSLWVSDHLFLDLAKYGGPARPPGRVRPDRDACRARRCRCAGRASARSSSARRCVRPRCSPSRWPASTASATVGSTSASGRGGTNRSTGRSGWRCRVRGSGWRVSAKRWKCCGGCSEADRSRSTGGITGRSTPTTIRPRANGRHRPSSSAGRATGSSRWWPGTPTAGTPAGRGRRPPTANASTCWRGNARRCSAIRRR